MPSMQSRMLQALPMPMPLTLIPAPLTVPIPPLVINIIQRTNPAAKFIKGVIQLSDNFPMLKEDRKWQELKKSVYITAKAQLVSKVLDKTYSPLLLDTSLFEHKKTYMLAVFKKNTNFKG